MEQIQYELKYADFLEVTKSIKCDMAVEGKKELSTAKRFAWGSVNII